MTQVCSKCSRVNPADAAYCYHDGAILAGHSVDGGPVNQGEAPFPSQFVFPSGQACRNFDQLAVACQQNWKSAVDLLKQGFLASFLGGLGRADLALAAQEAARFPDQDRGLDQLLAKLPSQVLEAPKLKVEPSELNLGQLGMGTDRNIELHLNNLGMRLCYGSVVSDCKWLTLGEPPGNAQKLFQFGADTVIPVQVRGQHLRAGTKALEGHLVIESNGGSATVLVRADVPVKPFSEGVLAGAISPRQIAEKAKAAPQQAAVLFEKGAVGQWFTLNGWTYPVQGPSASGLGAVQQFFEALGLAKAPKVELGTLQVSLRGNVGETLQTTVEVRSEEKKPVFAYATCDQAWVDVSKTKLNGRFATITVRIPNVPNRPGEALQAKIHVTGNGNQRFVVPLTLAVEGSASPFADLVEATAVSAEPIEAVAVQPGAVAAGVIEAQVFEPVQAIAAGHAGSAAAFADLGAAPVLAAPGHAAAGTVPPITPYSSRTRRQQSPVWMHLIPLAVLALALIGIMARDFFVKPAASAGGSTEEDRPELRIGVYFDYHKDKVEAKKKGLNQTMNFGLVQITDPHNPKDFKKLTYDPFGRTNTLVARIDKQDRMFGDVPKTGRWEEKPANLGRSRYGMSAGFEFLEKIQITQRVELVKGEPVEVGPDVYKQFLDTCLVRYDIVNRDSRPHTVGLRLLVDTFIGDNDGPTFTVPGLNDLVSTSRDFAAPKDRIPDFVQALEKPSIRDPGTIAHFTFRLGDKIEPPSRVSLTHWPGHNLGRHYDIPVKDIKDDSAVVIYWKDEKMAPNQKRELAIAISVGNVQSTEGAIGLSVGGSFSPGGELTVVALVNDPQPDQKLTLKLPSQFSLIASEATQKVPPGTTKLPDGRFRPSPVTWRVRSTVTGTFTFEVESSTGKVQKQRVTIKTNTLF